ncbi:hypothetical protein BH24ACT5_BH24ACT5_06550 [soil metagenome]
MEPDSPQSAEFHLLVEHLREAIGMDRRPVARCDDQLAVCRRLPNSGNAVIAIEIGLACAPFRESGVPGRGYDQPRVKA